MNGRILWLTTLLLLLFGDALFCKAQAPPVVTIQAAPERPIVELRNGGQSLNFDLIVRNQSSLTLRIAEVELSIFDSTLHLVLRKSINSDAFAPSIAVIGTQILKTGESLDVFNPFSEFESNVPLVQLEYSFCLQRESNEEERDRNYHRLPGDCDFHQKSIVAPRRYEGKTALILPLQGRIFVWEGHDFYAHHFRVPMSGPKVLSLGITANSNEFASDFVYLDETGRTYHGDPRKLENWYGYGKPIYAPGKGVVLATANDIPDRWFNDEAATTIGRPRVPAGKDSKDIGNFVLIDHQNGEYSLLVHMKSGSVSVSPGDHVAQGQPVGRVGFSGDSIFPHLHYCLMEGPEVLQAWGLPAYFMHFRRILGATSVEVNRGPVNSGDFLESDGTY